MRALALAAFALAVPAVAFASGGHGAPHFDGGAFTRHAVNLVILVAVLWKVGAGPFRDFLAFRKQEIAGGLDEAWAAKTRADARAAEVEARLSGIDAELSALLDQVRTDAAAERTRLEDAARRAAELIEATARRTVQDECARAQAEIRAHAVDAALAVAERLLSRNVGVEDQRRLSAKFVQQVGQEGRS